MDITKNVIVDIKKDKIEIKFPNKSRDLLWINEELMKDRTVAINYINNFIKKSQFIRKIEKYLIDNRVGIKVIGYNEDIYYLLYIELVNILSIKRLNTLNSKYLRKIV